MSRVAGYAATALAAVVLLTTANANAQEISSDQFQSMVARHIGPVGNRVTSVTGVTVRHRVLRYFRGAPTEGGSRSARTPRHR